MAKLIRIGKKVIGEGKPVFVIAEAGVNHNQRLDLAIKLIKVAKNCKADAIKFQTFKTEEVVTRNAALLAYQKSHSFSSQFDMLKNLELDESMHKKLIDFAKKLDIIFLSTPGDFDSVDLLDKLGVPAFKIGSDDLTNLPLLEYIAKKKKPVLLSTGMGTLDEVREAVQVLKKVPLVILHTTSLYPCPLEQVNLRCLITLKDTFKVPIGFSDHTSSVTAAIAAVGLGASVIEKHITLDRKLPGPDHKISYTPEEFKIFVELIRETELCLGSKIKRPTSLEKKDMFYLRKSIVAACDLEKGTILKKEHLKIKRPQAGLLPKEFYKIIGKKLKRKVKIDQPIKKEDICL